MDSFGENNNFSFKIAAKLRDWNIAYRISLIGCIYQTYIYIYIGEISMKYCRDIFRLNIIPSFVLIPSNRVAAVQLPFIRRFNVGITEFYQLLNSISTNHIA